MSNAVDMLPNKPASQGAVIESHRAVAEVAAAVRVAQDNPRDTSRAVEQMREVCGRLAVAERAFYSVPNRGSGLSVHIARELARIWGNADYGVRELARDDETGESEMQAWAWDVETNTRSTRSFIVPHAKSTKQGRKALVDLNDIYLNNQNVGARAVRECIFSILPGWLTSEAEQILKATLQKGDGASVEQRREAAIEKFRDLNVTEQQMSDFIGRDKGHWSASDLANLTRAYMSITQDGIPAQDFFPEKPVEIPA